MKEIFWVLPLLVKSQDYTFIKTECDGESATVVLEYIGDTDPDWGVFETARAGTCLEGAGGNMDFERDYSEDNKKMMVTFDPYACSGYAPNPADVTTYNVDTQLSFGESADTAVVIDGKTLGMDGGSGIYWTMQPQCTFSASYTTSADFHVTQNTGESATYDLGVGEQILEFEAHGTDAMFQGFRNDDEYTTDDVVYHIVGLGTDLATRSSDNSWAFPKRDIWKNFHVAPTAVKVISGSWSFDLLTPAMSSCGYSQIGFRAVGFHEDPQEDTPMGIFAWGFAYKGFTADDADASDLTLEVTLALCHKDDPNNACVAVLEKCSERQVNPTVPDEVPCEDREGYAGEYYLVDQFGECQFSGFECDCANGTPGYDADCMYNTVEKCAACDELYQLDSWICQPKPDTRSREYINNRACFLTVSEGTETWVNGEHGQWTSGTDIGTIHADYMENHGQGKYGQNQDCAWNFRVPYGKQLYITKTEFSVESHSACSYDAVRIEITEFGVAKHHHTCVQPSGETYTTGDVENLSQVSDCLFCSYGDLVSKELPDNEFAIPSFISFGISTTEDQHVKVRFWSDDDTEEAGFNFNWEIR